MWLIAMACWAWDRVPRIRVLKSWGGKYGVWFGAGWQSETTKPITRSWLVTVLPPYLRGAGVNISLWRLSLRGGTYRRLSDHDDWDDEVDTEGELAVLRTLGYNDGDKEEATWDYSDERASA